MIFLIYTILLILQQYKGMPTVVPDPCPSNFSNSTIVANMCMSSSATEEKNNGNFPADSVVLRIRIQQDNCICRVTIDNQMLPISIGMGKYNDLVSSAPEYNECGLAVDITHIPKMSTGNGTAPIECTENVDYRTMHLLKNSSLEFKSRISNGNFTRGYCIRIVRDTHSDHSQALRIVCDAPMTIEQTTIADTMTGTSTTTSPQTTDSPQSTSKRTKEDTLTKDQIAEMDPTAYIVISALSSTITILLLVVLVVTCIRYKALQRNVNRTNQNVDNTLQVEYNRHYCDLTNNIPSSEPGQEYDSIDSNYNTIDVDRSQTSNNILGMEGEYISVDPDGHLTTSMD